MRTDIPVPKTRRFRLTSGMLAALFTSALAALAWGVLKNPWWPTRNLLALFSPEQLEYLGTFDSYPQRKTHQLVLILTVVFSLCGLWLQRYGQRWMNGPRAATFATWVRRLTRPGPLITVLAVLAAIFLAAHDLPNAKQVVGWTLLFLAASFAVTFIRPRYVSALAWLLVAAYLAIFMVPGLFFPPSMTTFDSIWVQAHFNSTIGVGERLAAGLHLDDIGQNYGLLPATLYAIVERHFGPLETGLYFRSIQALNLAFALLATLAYRLWRPRSPLMILGPLLLVLPWIHSFHLSLILPNQSALRFIGLPLGVLLLLLIGRSRASSRPYMFGLIAGLLILVNLETGIALACGYFVYLAARVPSRRIVDLVRLPLLYLVGMASTGIAFAVLFRLGLGQWPYTGGPAEMLRTIMEFVSGFAGQPFEREAIPLLIFLHSTYILIRGALLWGKGPVSFATAFRMAIATTIMIWFAYYVNVAWYWYLWTYIFLYTFLAAQFFDPRLLKWKRDRVVRLKFSYGLLALGLVLVPLAIKLNHTAWSQVYLGIQDARHRPPASATMVSGILVRPEFAAHLADKIDFLRNQPDKNELAYFTVDSYFIPHLTGLYERRLKFRDAFAESPSIARFESLVARVLALAPPRILFDDPETIDPRHYGLLFPDQSAVRKFYLRLLDRLSVRYRKVGTEHGWLILARIDARG